MAKKELKIAIFHLAFIYSGGGERLVLEEAKGLKNLGHNVTIFTPVINRQKCFPDVISKSMIKTFLPHLPFIVPEHESFQILLTCILVPFFAFRFRNFDVILAANQPSPWIAWIVKKFYGVPYVSYLAQPTRFLYPREIDRKTGLIFSKRAEVSLSARLMQIAKGFIKWADKVSIKGSDLVLANGKHAKRLLDAIYGLRTVSCPAGAYPDRRVLDYGKRLKGKIKIGRRVIIKPYLLISNRHFAQKRFEYGVSVLSSLLQKLPDYSLLITGNETSYTNELKILIERLNLGDKVSFLGHVSERDLGTLYSQAALYLYTAPEEDFGMGMVEAMAKGTPVVAWNNAGPTGIIENGKTGLLAKPFRVADFSRKVLRVTSDRKLAEKLSSEALKEVRNKFSYKNHLKILEKALIRVSKQGIDEVNN